MKQYERTDNAYDIIEKNKANILELILNQGGTTTPSVSSGIPWLDEAGYADITTFGNNAKNYEVVKYNINADGTNNKAGFLFLIKTSSGIKEFRTYGEIKEFIDYQLLLANKKIDVNTATINEIMSVIQTIENTWTGNEALTGGTPTALTFDLKTLDGSKGKFTFGANDKLIINLGINGTAFSDEKPFRINTETSFHILGTNVDGGDTTDVSLTAIVSTDGILTVKNFHSTGTTNQNIAGIRIKVIEQNPKITAVIDAYTKAEADKKYALKTEIPSLTNYALKTELPSVSGFITETQADAKYATPSQIPDLTPYQTTAQADGKYATKSQLPDLAPYQTTAIADGKYALKTQIPDTTGFITQTTADGRYELKGQGGGTGTAPAITYTSTQEVSEYLNNFQDIPNGDVKVVNGKTFKEFLTGLLIEEEYNLSNFEDDISYHNATTLRYTDTESGLKTLDATITTNGGNIAYSTLVKPYDRIIKSGANFKATFQKDNTSIEYLFTGKGKALKFTGNKGQFYELRTVSKMNILGTPENYISIRSTGGVYISHDALNPTPTWSAQMTPFEVRQFDYMDDSNRTALVQMNFDATPAIGEKILHIKYQTGTQFYDERQEIMRKSQNLVNDAKFAPNPNFIEIANFDDSQAGFLIGAEPLNFGDLPIGTTATLDLSKIDTWLGAGNTIADADNLFIGLNNAIRIKNSSGSSALKWGTKTNASDSNVKDNYQTHNLVVKKNADGHPNTWYFVKWEVKDATTPTTQLLDITSTDDIAVVRNKHNMRIQLATYATGVAMWLKDDRQGTDDTYVGVNIIDGAPKLSYKKHGETQKDIDLVKVLALAGKTITPLTLVAEDGTTFTPDVLEG